LRTFILPFERIASRAALVLSGTIKSASGWSHNIVYVNGANQYNSYMHTAGCWWQDDHLDHTFQAGKDRWRCRAHMSLHVKCCWGDGALLSLVPQTVLTGDIRDTFCTSPAHRCSPTPPMSLPWCSRRPLVVRSSVFAVQSRFPQRRSRVRWLRVPFPSHNQVGRPGRLKHRTNRPSTMASRRNQTQIPSLHP